MKRNILIVEDDIDINYLLKTIIEGEGYEVTQAFSGTEAKLCLKSSLPDLMLLDLMLPGMTGEEVLQLLREELHCDLPVIVLSAKDTVHDKVTLLRLGADDYITKPFEPEEVIARIQAALRRSSLQTVEEPKSETVLNFRELKLDTELRKVMIHEHELTLTGREYEILHLFMQNPEKVFSRESLYEQVWQDGYYGTDHTVTVHVSNLRKKIKEYTQEEYIQSVYGVGFRLAKT